MTRKSLLTRFSRVPSAHDVIDELVAQQLLLERDSPADRFDRAVADAWAWGQDARYLHYSTRRTTYEADLEREADELARRARDRPPPSPVKSSERPAIALPGSFESPSGDFWDVLRARRTRRSFASRSVSLADFAAVLRWTWGATETRVDAALGPYVLKTSPSGGSRHPVEVYPVVLRVEGIAPGVYHYAVGRDALEPIGGEVPEHLVVELCAGQPWVARAAAVCFMTGFLPRIMWKYEQSHAYRVLQLDAGHLGQTFHLVCTKLGLDPFTTAAIDAPSVERELGLDGVTEVALYAAAFG